MLIRKPIPQDREKWGSLYAGYAEFYKVEQSEEMRTRIWEWIHDHKHEVEAFVAEDGGQLVGLAHFRPFARPLAASMGGFLDDLFVTPAARGSGAARALIEAIAAEGKSREWTVIRWITAADNARARALYDKLSMETKWVTYDLKI